MVLAIPQSLIKYLFLGIVGLLGYLVFLNVSFMYYNLKLGREQSQLRGQINVETKNHAELTRQLAVTDTDEYVEEIARTRLGLVKKDEIAYQLIAKKKRSELK